MVLSVRQTTEEDWCELKALRLESLTESPESFGLTLSAASVYTEAQWKDRAGNRTPPTYFIAHDADVPIGLVGGVMINSAFNLIAMWVAPSHRSRGIGRALVRKLLSFAKSRGESEVSLMVSPLNATAYSLYKRMGFVSTEYFEPLESDPNINLQRMTAKIN